MNDPAASEMLIGVIASAGISVTPAGVNLSATVPAGPEGPINVPLTRTVGTGCS